MFARAIGAASENMKGGVWLDSVTICEIHHSNRRLYIVPGNYRGDVIAAIVDRGLLVALPPHSYEFFEKSTGRSTSRKLESNDKAQAK
jgi:hypothetical protein